MQPNETARKLIQDLKKDLLGEVRDDPLSLQLYSTDASDFRKVPTAVVMPKTVRDVCRTVQAAGRHNACLIPRGGGSSLSGQTIGTGLIVDHSRHLNRLLELNVRERYAWVEAGLVLDRLNQAAGVHGLMVGPDPSSSAVATLGGMAGNNSTGAHSIKYGLMVDHVLEMEVVLSDGTLARLAPMNDEEISLLAARDSLEGRLYREIPRILDAYAEDIAAGYPKTWRNVAGYNLNRLEAERRQGKPLNLASLVVGSEGTLASIVRLKVNLVPRPRCIGLLILHFDHLEAALAKVPLILNHDPGAVELMTYPTLKLAHDHPAVGAVFRRYVHGLPAAVLIVELTADQTAQLEAAARALTDALRHQGYAGPVTKTAVPGDISRIWSIRKAVFGLMASKPRPTKRTSIIDDAAVPVERMIDFTRAVAEAGRRHGLEINFDAHASAGCLHLCPELDLKNPQTLKTLESFAREIMSIAIAHDGTTTGEHGEGLARSYFNRQLYGERLHQAFGEVKRVFDPFNRLNPGKIVNAGEPWNPAWLKYHPGYANPHEPQHPVFDYGDYRRFSGLVEMCNGMGVCRGEVSGGMCPSYRVTRDELHSTRGRANALRAALTGALGTQGLANRELLAALDLCLSCKACKTECAARVDMTKLKAEVLAQVYRREGIPLRSRMIGAMPWLGRIGSLAPDLTNRLLSSTALHGLLERVISIDRRRSLPSVARQGFLSWLRAHARGHAAPRGAVVLWDDCHIRHHQPELGRDAVRVLEAAGFEVICVPGVQCCGRPMLSKGMLVQARARARHNVQKLFPYVRDGIPVIGVEPSCIACFRDEYPDLLGSAAAREVAQSTRFFEEFITNLARRGELDLEFEPPPVPRRVLVHTHCYQKALGTADQVLDMLRLLPDTHVEAIDSGCCGMAGSFGYEKGHYELSMAIGELALFPAVRAVDARTIIAAAGTSCREQIKDGAQRHALHPISILADGLKR